FEVRKDRIPAVSRQRLFLETEDGFHSTDQLNADIDPDTGPNEETTAIFESGIRVLRGRLKEVLHGLGPVFGEAALLHLCSAVIQMDWSEEAGPDDEEEAV